MPELPEVETLAQKLKQHIIGLQCVSVKIFRTDIIRNQTNQRQTRCTSQLRTQLLENNSFSSIKRLGKQLVIQAPDDKIMCIHLGMSGRLSLIQKNIDLTRQKHIHVLWNLKTTHQNPYNRLIFQDPRRFGGIWTFPDNNSLITNRWHKLGPDALNITPQQLHKQLQQTTKPIKAALLDQNRIAGVGNIYADESLFHAKINPRTPANQLTPNQTSQLAKAIKYILKKSIKHGGTTLKDYFDPTGNPGTFIKKLKAYNHGGKPCPRCKNTIMLTTQCAQRTTTHCPNCQK